MYNDQNTDKLIREKLVGFSAAPPPHIWNNIQGEMAALNRKKRMAFVGWSSAAAMVLLAFVAGWYFSDSPEKIETPFVETEVLLPKDNLPDNQTETIPFNVEISEISTDDKIVQPTATNAKSKPNERILLKSNSVNAELEPKEAIHLSKRENYNFRMLEKREILLGQNLQNVGLAQYLKAGLQKKISASEEILIAANLNNMLAEKNTETGWRMGVYISPGYSSHVANHSDSYNRQMSYSGNEGNGNVGGGFSVQYKTRKKWIVESGMYYAQNGQKSEKDIDVFSLRANSDAVYSGPGEMYFANKVNVSNGNMAMNSTAGVVVLSGTPKGAEIASDFETSQAGISNSLISSGEFSQVFNFVEIPFFVRYNLIDSKIGVEFIGGVNAGVVVGNNAYIDNEFGLQNIGKTQDISTLNFSGTLGVGLNYALGKHISLGIEPRLNYYLSSINNNPEVDFRPYRIGFYTGVYYEF